MRSQAAGERGYLNGLNDWNDWNFIAKGIARP